MMKSGRIAGLSIVLLATMDAQAGHLFTQNTINTPIKLEEGQGIEITQERTESFGTKGDISLDFAETGHTSDFIWDSGDAIKISISGWEETFSFDSDGGGDHSLNLTSEELKNADITLGDPTKWTVIATAGGFEFTGYRIDVAADGTVFDGTGAGKITQDQVVTADELTGASGFEEAAGSNQKALGAHLDDIQGQVSGGLANAITLMSAMTDESKDLAIKKISPLQSQSLEHAVSNTVSQGLDTVQVRLESLRNGIRAPGGMLAKYQHQEGRQTGRSAGDDFDRVIERHVWMKAIGGRAERDRDDNFAGSDSDFYGMMGGADFTLEQGLTLGAALAFGNTDVDMNDYREGDSNDADLYQVTGYFTQPFNKFYVEGMFSYSHYDYETERNTGIAGIAKGDFNGEMYGGRITSGMPLALPNKLEWTPFISLEALRFEQDSYTETGAGPLSLNVAANGVTRVRSILGSKLSYNHELKDGSTIMPVIEASWQHEFNNDGLDTTAAFVGGGGEFESIGQTTDRNIIGLKARVNWAKSDRLMLGLQAGTQISSDYHDYHGQLYASLSF